MGVQEQATGEKPSFLVLGIDCRTPKEAALLPPAQSESIEEFSDYRQELAQSLSSARTEAAKSIRRLRNSIRDSMIRRRTRLN